MKNQRDNKRFWEKVSGLYGLFMKFSGRLYNDICEQIRPHLNREMTVLELACGTGQLSIPLSCRVRLWEATDFSNHMIAEAKKNGGSSRLHFSVQDATCLPYGSETFDAVVIANALHIMPEPQLALEEIHRILKPNGHLFAPTFVQGNSVGFRVRMALMGLVGFRTFHKWSASALAEYVSGFGFQITEQTQLGGSLTPLCCLCAEKSHG